MRAWHTGNVVLDFKRSRSLGDIDRDRSRAREAAVRRLARDCSNPAVLWGQGIEGEATTQIYLWQKAGFTPMRACREMGVIENRSWDVVRHHLVKQLQNASADDRR